MLEIKNLYKSFGRQQVLVDVNAQFAKSDVVGIIGPNGCGKTTLIKSILGLVKPDKGEIYFNNVAVTHQAMYREFIGYMPQIGRYPESMTIGQLFEMLKEIRDHDYGSLDEELIREFKLDLMLKKTLGSLSGGTIQKVSAACAYLFNPEVLIFDEPTAGLDPVSTEILKSKMAVGSNERITLITSHILNDLEDLATHIFFMNEKKVLFFEKLDHLRARYGEEKLGKIIATIMKEQNAYA